MRRLPKDAGRKVFLISDNLKVHHSKAVKEWLEKNREKIEVFYLPSYSPELNPDEYLNNSLKGRVHSGERAQNANQLESKARKHMRNLQNNQHKTIKFFKHPCVAYGRSKSVGLASSQVSFNAKGAASVYLSYLHTVVLLKNGRLLFWGGCKSSNTVENSEILPSDGIVSGAYGQVTDVKTMAMPGNDDANPNVFLKQDGTVWRAYAPVPPGTEKLNCARGRRVIGESWQLSGMNVPAIAIRANSISVMALGADHTIWLACNNFMHPDDRFVQIHINLKEE